MDRFEIKYDVTDKNLHDLISELNLIPLYEERLIQNTYYDTYNLNFFHDSEEGIVPRKKVRIRSYNSINKKNLEVKFTNNFSRKKDVYNNVDINNFKNYLNVSKVKENLNPILNLKYNRKYFSCKFGRITYDYNLKFSKYNQNFYLKDNFIRSILELKTSENLNKEKFIRNINMKNIRFSKYCYALNYLFYF